MTMFSNNSETLQARLRAAMPEDMERMFQWRNMPEIVALGRTQKAVSWEDHQAWFRHTLHDPCRVLLIILLDDQPIGQVRFDQIQHEDDACEVSIYLLAAFTGRGLGTCALKKACAIAFERLDVRRIDAVILKENRRSLSAFQKAGFQDAFPESPESFSDHIKLTLRRPPDISRDRIKQEFAQVAGVELLDESCDTNSDGRLTRPSNCAMLQTMSGLEVPHNRITHGLAEAEAVVRTVRSGYWVEGPQVAVLERTLAEIAGVEYAVCVASGLSALRLTLKGLGIQPEDQVLVPAYSCVALANAVMACGARPIPVDITESHWTLNSIAAQQAVNTSAIHAAIVVHTFGLPAESEPLREKGIPVIEDCAHAFGMAVNGKALGGQADAAILSFYATKLIAAGEGGAVLTRSSKLADFIRSWRNYGDQAADGTRFNDKMTDIEATLALCQLQRLKEMLACRRALAERYHEAFSRLAERTEVFRLPDISHNRVWYRYAVEMRSKPAANISRQLRVWGIHAEQPVWDWRLSSAPACPVADRAYRWVLSLPLYPSLTFEEQDRVIHSFKEVCQEDA